MRRGALQGVAGNTRRGPVVAAGLGPRHEAGRIVDLRISPDGQSWLFVANDRHNLVLRDIASGRERTVLHDGESRPQGLLGVNLGRIGPATVSRDGKRIAFVYITGNGAEIRVIDTSGGAVRTVPGTSARPVPLFTLGHQTGAEFSFG